MLNRRTLTFFFLIHATVMLLLWGAYTFIWVPEFFSWSSISKALGPTLLGPVIIGINIKLSLLLSSSTEYDHMLNWLAVSLGVGLALTIGVLASFMLLFPETPLILKAGFIGMGSMEILLSSWASERVRNHAILLDRMHHT